MKEKQLLKIALTCSFVGLVALFFFTSQIEELNISKLGDIEEGRDVKIIGKIEKISDTGKVMYITLGQEKIETVDVMLFKDSDFVLYKGQTIEIEGEITEYQGKKVVANQVRII